MSDFYSKDVRDKKGRFKKGFSMSEKAKKKISLLLKGKKKDKVYFGIEAPNWKGDKVGYRGLHIWVDKQLGKPSVCEQCGIKDAKRYEWANKSGEYKRDVSDWKRLCVKCHRIKDDWVNKVARKQRGGEIHE